MLDATGQPRVRWWPVAFALQRLEDPRALPALLTLAQDPHPYTRAFAAKGLACAEGSVGGAGADAARRRQRSRSVAIEAIRALGRLGDPAAAPPLLQADRTPKADPQLRLEAVAALAGISARASSRRCSTCSAIRAPRFARAALRALAQLDPENFVTVLSGLDPDPHWSVRAALATVLGTLPPETGLPRSRRMLDDTDQRVDPRRARVARRAAGARCGEILLERLKPWTTGRPRRRGRRRSAS